MKEKEKQVQPKTSRKVIKAVLMLGLIAVLIITAIFVGSRLSGNQEVKTDLGKVAFSFYPSLEGKIDGYVPVTDWGVRFKRFWLPLTVEAELRALNREEVLSVAEGNRQAIKTAEEDLKTGFKKSFLITLAYSFAVLLFLIAASYPTWKRLKRKWLFPVSAVTGFALLIIAAVITIQVKTSSGLLNEPTFYASGVELQQILKVVDDAEVESAYGSEFESIVRSVSSLLATGQTNPEQGQSFYLGSDLHANPLVIKPVSEIVGENPVLLTGDFGQQGNKMESSFLAPKIAAIGKEVVTVSGNHDSENLMESLAKQGIMVLTKKGELQGDGSIKPPVVKEINGIKIAGLRDPLEYSEKDKEERIMTFSSEDAYFKKRWVEQALNWFTRLKDKPDVLMIHQNSLATSFAEALVSSEYSKPLTIATGHTHKQGLEKFGSIVVVNSGTIGAGGAFEAGEAGIGMAHLTFSNNGTLRLVEFLLVEPFSGAAQAHRLEMASLCSDKKHCKATIPTELIGQ